MSIAAIALAVPAIGPDLLDPANLDRFGSAALWVAVAIVFAETGLLVGFFLPGDSLLFMVGLLVAQGVIGHSLAYAAAVLTLAAVIGSMTGYWIGHRAGPPLFNRPNSRLFKQKHVEQTQAFFAKHGPRAIVLARFVPIVRTFITAMAGVGRMDLRVYALYSGIGAVLWAAGVSVMGYYLGTVPFVKGHLEMLLLGMVAVSVVPIVVETVRQRRAPVGA